MSMSTRVLSLAFAGLVLAPAAAAAQPSSGVTFGAKAGVNASNLKADSAPNLKSVWGAVGGIFLGTNVTQNVGLQLEALFSQRGARDNSPANV